MEFNLADLFESAVDEVPDRECLVVDDSRRTFAQLEERSNRCAHHLLSVGVGPGDHVALLGRNSVEWVEAMWAVFKIRAVPINVNFRYSEPEVRYLIENSDAVAAVVDRQYLALVGSSWSDLEQFGHVMVVEDGTDDSNEVAGIEAVDYEASLAAASPTRDFEPRSGDDRYILYTGGTTGLPKGVVWRQHDQFMNFGGRGDATLAPHDVIARGLARPPVITSSFAPLMHNNGQWTMIGMVLTGNKAVLTRKFDAVRAWETVERERVNVMRIVGDGMGAPLAEVLAADPERFDLSALRAIGSGGAMLSPRIKDALLELLPGIKLSEVIGSTESGTEGSSIVAKGSGAASATRVTPAEGTLVVGDDLRPVAVGAVGRIARTGYIPLGYYKDDAKTKATFPYIDGRRYVVPGDFARVEADGTITMLGRGSTVINTGGEKVHPEEVEAIVKAHPDVIDATVVGVPDERWGQSVAAVVQVRYGAELSLASLRAHCLESLAGYKVPSSLKVVEEFFRHDSGKPNYTWAAGVATGGGVEAAVAR